LYYQHGFSGAVLSFYLVHFLNGETMETVNAIPPHLFYRAAIFCTKSPFLAVAPMYLVRRVSADMAVM
jgi:hypothetical protein